MQRFVVVFALVAALLGSVFYCSAFILIGAWVPAFGYPIYRGFGKWWLRCFGIRVHQKNTQYLNASPSFVVAPNHQSNFDVFILLALDPFYMRWIAKRALYYVPFLGLAYKAQGSYFVRRGGNTKDLEVMEKVEKDLQAGHSICIFPEGTRSRDGKLGPFKKGAFRLSQNSGVPLLPMAIRGTYDLAPRGKLPRRWGHDVYINFGEPFLVPKEQTIEVAMGRYRELLEKLIEAA